MLHCSKCCLNENVSHLVVSNALQPHGLQPTRLLCPWNSPGKNTGVGCHSLLQGIFLTQGSNLGFLHCKQILYCLNHQGSPLLRWDPPKMGLFQLVPPRVSNVHESHCCHPCVPVLKMQQLCLSSFPPNPQHPRNFSPSWILALRSLCGFGFMT